LSKIKHPGYVRRLLLFIWLGGILSAIPATAQIDYLLSPDQLGSASLEFPPEVMVLESSFNTVPNFEPIKDFTRENRYRQLGRSVGRLDILVEHNINGSNAMATCTATIISEIFILTNYHCIPGMDPDYTVRRAVLNMGYLDKTSGASAVYEVGITPVEAVRELDYAVLRVAGDPSDRFDFIPLLIRDPLPGEELFIVHHPEGLPQRLTRRNCRLMPSATAITETVLRHRCDTKSGSSGSLIFSDNNNGDSFAVVGLHYAGFKPGATNPYNEAKRLTAIISQSSVLGGVAANARVAASTPSVDPAPAPANQPVLLPPSVLFAGNSPVADNTPLFTAQSRQEDFNWGMNQILEAAKYGFFAIKENGPQVLKGTWSSKINLPQYASTPADNCTVHDLSGGSNTATWTSCLLGESTNYDMIATRVRSALPVITESDRGDSRGMAIRIPGGAVVCLEKSATTIMQLLGHNSLVRLTVWSTNSTNPSCFTSPAVMMK
jgi:Trypsin-like peptidase domain